MSPRPLRRRIPPALPRLAALAAVTLSLAACDAMTRMSEIGAAPALTTIQDPKKQPGYQPVSLPMPTPMSAERRPNSLWQAGTRAFFKDQRANQIGDILTVIIDISEQAKLSNETTKNRNNSENTGINSAFGFEAALQKILPHTANTASLLSAGTTSKQDGIGTINRTDQVKLNVAMLVNQVLPNGNLVVIGHQEMRVNFEVRELQITGVIRPQDISATNTIPLEKIAEARVSYGGRGQLMDAQQARYGQQLFDIISPF
jgi:flagellar L-ring protein precursor FlgH